MIALPPFSFAFQPIYDMASGQIVSQEALVRGPAGESAYSVLSQLTAPGIYQFDERLRAAAIRLAAKIGGPEALHLNLNLMPRSLEVSPSALASTLETAQNCGLSPESITIEITESEIIHDIEGFVAVANEYRGTGIQYAIDDFGAGYAGLYLLAEFQPDALKLDRQLVAGIERDGPRQAIVRGVLRTCEDLGIDVIAEGVETEAEFSWFRSEGVDLFQGYLLARPGFEQLPGVAIPGTSARPTPVVAQLPMAA